MPRTNNIDIFKMPELTLASPQFTVNPYVPIQFDKPQSTVDDAIQSLKDINALDKEAREKDNAVQAAFADQRKLIHGDAKTLKMFDDQVAKYNQQIKDAVNANSGSYFRALNAATNAAKQAIEDKMFPQMVKIGTQVNEWKNKLKNNKNIPALRAERYSTIVDTDENFDNNFVRDNNGNIIGGNDWVSPINVVEDKTDIEMEAELKAFVAPSSSGYENSSDSYNTGANLKNKGNLGDNVNLTGADVLYRISHQGGKTTESITDKQWDDAVDAYFKLYNNEKIITERIKDDEYEYQKLKQKINNNIKSGTLTSQVDRERYEQLEKELYPDGKGATVTAKNRMKQYLKNFAHVGSFVRTKTVNNNSSQLIGNPTKDKESSYLTKSEIEALYGTISVRGAGIGVTTSGKVVREHNGKFEILQ